MSSPQPNRRRLFASLLWRLADLTQVDERRRSFRAKAYRRAVWSLDDLEPALDQPEEEMLEVPGIGPGLVSLIDEYVRTGRLSRLETLQARYPREAGRMRRLPRANQGVLRAMKEELGVEVLDDLEAAIGTGAVSTLPGIGEATAALWRRILDASPPGGPAPAHRAWVTARQIGEHLERHLDAVVSETGAVRRVEDWVEEIELLLGTDDPGRVRGFLDRSAIASDVAAAVEGRIALHTHDGLRAVVHLTRSERFGSALVETTGPESHLIETFSGRVPSFPTEPEVYRSAGMDWVPPAARVRPLEEARKAVTVADLRGDLHIHTDASPDGRVTLQYLVEACIARGYRYLLVTDHTKGLRFGGLDEVALAEQGALVADLRRWLPDIEIFHGAELNIGIDGDLDIGDDTLDLLDFSVAAVHSRFDLDESRQTERVLTAMRHPKVKILGHPLGRRIGIRPALDLDLEAVLGVAAEEGVALETNGHRDRLDVPAELAERALASGCLLAANSDAHRLGELANVENAVATAQRAGALPAQVVNTWELDAFRAWATGQ